MPKMKNHSGASKRFKMTGGGKVRRYKAYGSHILTKKSSRRKRSYRQCTTVAHCHKDAMHDLLPYPIK